MVLQAPGWADIFWMAGLILALLLLGKVLVPHCPRLVRALLAIVISAAVLSFAQNCFAQPLLPFRGWTVTLLSLLGIPGLLLLLVMRLILLC